ncbi:uncharacterized protein LOC125825347 [Solanum verrucosum]|uniref:uncharacterized protein LOC125825347 n=1 Tax=Solanum verrucosum TaxID=315347 RepID=UPI0020D1D2AD|nr:uncharacterized protein LOC125825347 [Solanum verrucosum]
MPPRRPVRGHPARRNVDEQELPNAPEVQPQGEVTNAKFREAIRMLSQVVTNQAGHQRGARQEEAGTSRIREFLRMNPLIFTGSSTAEYSENFIEKLKKVFDMMHVTDTAKIELTAYQMKNKQKGHAPSSANAPTPKNKGEYYGQNYRAKPAYSHSSMAQRGSKPPTCAKCGRNHSGKGQARVSGACTGCGPHEEDDTRDRTGYYTRVYVDVYVSMGLGRNEMLYESELLGCFWAGLVLKPG